MKKYLISVLMVCCLLLYPSVSVLAHEIPDPAKNGHCSITVQMVYEGKAVSGGSLTLYKVGEVSEKDGNDRFTPVDEIKDEISSFEDPGSAELAEKLASMEKKLPVVKNASSVEIGADGTALFSDLEFGLYLVVQKTAAPGYEKILPFLTGVPYAEDGVYHYDRTGTPKTKLQQKERPEKPSSRPSSSHSGTTGTTGTTDTASPAPAEGKLPQTGQLWWPVPVLAAAGLVCIGIGIKRRKEVENETE